MTYIDKTLNFRIATHNDVMEIAQMAKEFTAFFDAIDGQKTEFDMEDKIKRLKKLGFGEKPLFSSIIAENEDEAVGYAIYSLGFHGDTFQGMLILSDLFIREKWRASGIGKKFMEHLVMIAKSEGCGVVSWTVWTRNSMARNFYDKIGAVYDEEEYLMRLYV